VMTFFTLNLREDSSFSSGGRPVGPVRLPINLSILSEFCQYYCPS
jgi:hypothetical protein